MMSSIKTEQNYAEERTVKVEPSDGFAAAESPRPLKNVKMEETEGKELNENIARPSMRMGRNTRERLKLANLQKYGVKNKPNFPEEKKTNRDVATSTERISRSERMRRKLARAIGFRLPEPNGKETTNESVATSTERISSVERQQLKKAKLESSDGKVIDMKKVCCPHCGSTFDC
uniref:Uncharacterized protein n=1 Tax=Meloidogyne hapla TaxID=6305 RepID=A0A1I8B1S4_MELHA